MNAIILVFCVGLLPSWTGGEIIDAYWKSSEAIVFLYQNGLSFDAPTLSVIGAGFDQMSLDEANAAMWDMPRDGRTIYLVLYPTSWRGYGFAQPSKDYAAVAYRQQMDSEWSYFSATMAHEILHLYGATDKYECDEKGFCECRSQDPDIMCSLSYRRINDVTRMEIQ